MIYAVVVAALGFGIALFGLIWTIAQGAARRARERADRVVADEGLVAEAAYSVNLLGATSLRRRDIRGVGVLVLTAQTLEFRLGYGTTSITVNRTAIVDVSVATRFRMPGRLVRTRRPIVLVVRWREADAEHQAGFTTRQAREICDRIQAS